MQKRLSNVYRALQVVGEKNLTGCLTISVPQDNSVGWQLYLSGNRLYYATSTSGSIERLACLWNQLQIPWALPNIVDRQSEYDGLCAWQQSAQIPVAQFRQIILQLTREVIIHALAYKEAEVIFEPNACIKPPFIATPVDALIRDELSDVRRWQQMHHHIPSPFSRLYLDLSKIDEFCNFWEESRDMNPLQVSYYTANSSSAWIEILDRKLSLYEIAKVIGTKVGTLATQLYPSIEKGLLSVLPFREQVTEQTRPSPSGPLIACIDDSQTVQRQVKMVLEMANYQVLSILDPATSLTSLIRNKPALILLDINMPEINGYDLCRMLHQSRQLKDIPVVMFTGRDGLIDRVRSQMVGAVDYITKPVEPATLIAKVQSLTTTKTSVLKEQVVGTI